MSIEEFSYSQEKIGLRIKQWRKSNGVKSNQMANTIGIQNANFSRIENGKGNFTPQQLFALKTIYQINLHWLLTGEGSMFLGETPVPGSATSAFTSKTCSECGQEYGLDKLVKEKDERLETQKRHITILEKETQRLESEVEEIKGINERLKRGLAAVENEEVKRRA